MEPFNPAVNVENANAILDGGEWPNFHDAIIYSLNIWRGDTRPEQNIWVFPTIEASFELGALEHPYVVDMRFHDCSHIRLTHFDHTSDIYMLSFAFESRGFYKDGVTPLPPYISVTFERGHGWEPMLSFKCFRVEALRRRPVPPPPCR